MEILAFGDPHIKPVNPAIDFDALTIPPNIDVVVTIGDVVQRPGDLETGREFFERLNDSETPIICVPGNHDPAEHYPEMIDGLENVTFAHDHIVTADDLEIVRSGRTAEFTFAGLGCETTRFEPDIGTHEIAALDPRAESDRRHAADVAAQALEDAVFDYVVGDTTRDALVSTLDIQRDERRLVFDALDEVERRFDRLDALFNRSHSPDVFCSHVPPYNTALDRHRSVGERERDLEGLHVGSLGLKIAVRKHTPFVTVSGHSHNREYEVGTADTREQPHFLSLDFRGIVRVSVDTTAGTFAYEFL